MSLNKCLTTKFLASVLTVKDRLWRRFMTYLTTCSCYASNSRTSSPVGIVECFVLNIVHGLVIRTTFSVRGDRHFWSGVGVYQLVGNADIDKSTAWALEV